VQDDAAAVANVRMSESTNCDIAASQDEVNETDSNIAYAVTPRGRSTPAAENIIDKNCNHFI